MRLTLVAPVVVTALASCSPKPSPSPTPPSKDDNLTIEVVLAKDNNKCLARIKDPGLKDAKRARVPTTYTVTWKVVGNDCGEKTKINKKALGLKSMKLKGTAADSAFWLKGCSDLPRVPPGGGVEFNCPIPTSTDPGWHWTGDEQIYEYEIDGDEVEPGDPDLGIKRNG